MWPNWRARQFTFSVKTWLFDQLVLSAMKLLKQVFSANFYENSGFWHRGTQLWWFLDIYSRETAVAEEMRQSPVGLLTERTKATVGPFLELKPIRHPNFVLDNKPSKEYTFRRRPNFPNRQSTWPKWCDPMLCRTRTWNTHHLR